MQLWIRGILVFPIVAFSLPFHYFDPTDTSAVPKLLSQTGAYSNTHSKQVDSSAQFYEVNAPLWSDGAVKSRWIFLPKGKSIEYIDTSDFFNYPDSTVFMKTFQLDKKEGDTASGSSRIFWETRLLVKKLDAKKHLDWYGFSYRWRMDQSDADLVTGKNGFDTVISFTTHQNRLSYKKWHFPSRTECLQCHRVGVGYNPFGGGDLIAGRAILGFYPAQLKRKSQINPTQNQVNDFFDRGIFVGSKPTSSDLSKRFKSIHEPISPLLSLAERFAVIDTMARSYIAANCSGCHGLRGLAVGAPGPATLNYDFYKLVPQMEFGMRPVADVGLYDTLPYDTNKAFPAPKGRGYLRLALSQWGINSDPGATWNLSLTSEQLKVSASVLVYPGAPALTEIVYRQWTRNSPAMDSGKVSRVLKYNRSYGGDSLSAKDRQSWLFKNPWGSEAWLNALTQHHVTLAEVFSDTVSSNLGYSLFDWDQNQMPPLATYIPDTAALALLGEWAKNYQSLGLIAELKRSNLNPSLRFLKTQRVFIKENTLFTPLDWRDEPELYDLGGRRIEIIKHNQGSYALPNLRVGFYMIRQGSHHLILKK